MKLFARNSDQPTTSLAVGSQNASARLAAITRDESGQDTVEYTMLLAFVCVLAAAMFVSFGGEAASIWTAADNSLVRASAIAASGKGL